MKLHSGLTWWALLHSKASLIPPGGWGLGVWQAWAQCWAWRGGGKSANVQNSDSLPRAVQSSSASGWSSWWPMNACPDSWSPGAQRQKLWDGQEKAQEALRPGNQGRWVLCFWHPKSQCRGGFKVPKCSDKNKLNLKGSWWNENYYFRQQVTGERRPALTVSCQQ